MTTPPKVRRFHLSRAESPVAAARIAATGKASGPAEAMPKVRVEVHRRTQPESGAAAPDGPSNVQGVPEDLFAPSPDDDGFAGMHFPGGVAAAERPADNASAPGLAPDSSAADAAQDPIAAIRAENLTSRQLRMAARIAAMHGIEVESEYEAVHRLRERGIDPFHRSAVGQVLSDEGARSQAAPSPQAPVPLGRGGLPAKRRAREIAPLPPPGPLGRPGPTQLPSREELTEERRAAEIWRIQRDIAKRRRRRLALLMMRLAFFVGLPTLIAGWYYFTQATPLYATNSQFLIQQASSTGAGELGSLFSGTQLATNPDSVSVQSYLNSRDAMNRLDQELGFKRAFQDPSLDPLLRLPQDATNEQAYKLYQQSVKIGYDPTEGVINMEVIAPDPRLSQEFSVALIRYAEGQVDQMTARLREDQMKGAVESYHDAEGRVQEAQNRVQQLQEQMGVLDPMAEGSVVMNQVAQLEGQLSEKRLELGQLQANPRPNQSRVAGVQGDIQRLEQMIADTRAQLTENTGKRASLARISGEIRIAESDLLTRQELLATAAAQMETARIEANKQVRYLSLSVAPVAPDEPTYPRALQNTIVAFLLFAGIYLMLSLTASILREQVST